MSFYSGGGLNPRSLRRQPSTSTNRTRHALSEKTSKKNYSLLLASYAATPNRPTRTLVSDYLPLMETQICRMEAPQFDRLIIINPTLNRVVLPWKLVQAAAPRLQAFPGISRRQIL